MGSWKIIAMSLPRSSRYCFSDRVARSLPSNSREPPATCPGSAKRPMMDRLVTDLPEPDSPTIARIACVHVEAHVFDGADDALLDGELR